MTKEQNQSSTEQPKKSRVLRREMKVGSATVKEKATRNKNAQQPKAEAEVPKGRVRIRLIPIWLRIIIVVLLLVAAIALGAIFGYAIIGDGEAADVFKKETWQHIFDIMNGVE